jgi:Transposase DDE domain
MVSRVTQETSPKASNLGPGSIDPLAVLKRLPLADAVLKLFSHVLSPSKLDSIFEAHRGRSFEQVLSFPTFVQLIADALIEHKGSGRQSFKRAREKNVLETSDAAVYSKLRRIPLRLSLGFLEEPSCCFRQLYPTSAKAWMPPACLEGMTPVVLDGKTAKKVAKRLKGTRHAVGKISGGKLLVATLPQLGLILTMTADLDGETNEAKLVPDLLPRVKPLVPSNRLWIADRQFGDPVQIGRFLEQDGDHVLVRWDGRTTFNADTSRPARTTCDTKGRTVIEEWGWLGAESNKRRRYLRRITLIRPGEERVILMTDLLDEEAYPASDLLEVYLARWQIERVFQQITEVFNLQRLIGSTAEATIFQAAFCMVLYNMIQVVKAYIAAGRDEITLTEEVSSEQIFYDVQRQLIALSEVVPPAELAAIEAPPMSLPELQEWLSDRLGSLWSDRWKKAVNTKPRKPKPKQGSCFGAHNSVHRLLNLTRAG